MLDEGYSATAPDLSSLVTKLKRARPDVIFHTGYNPDISLFLRQARELGLRFSVLIGQGAGYTDYTRIKQAVGTDANYFFDVDPISIWETNPEALKPELPPMIKMIGDAYMKAKPDTIIKSPHLGMAASNTYLFLTDVLPRAIKKYGGVNADALAKAARDTDVPDGGTMLGFGVKFEGVDEDDGRAEHPRLPGGDPVHRRQELRGVAEGVAAARAGEAAGQFALRRAVMRAGSARDKSVLEVAGLIKRFGGFTAVSNVSFKVDQGEILGLIGPNGSGKSTIFNMLSGTFAPTAGSIRFAGARDRRHAAASHHPSRHRPDVPDPAAVPAAVDLRERGAGRVLRQ